MMTSWRLRITMWIFICLLIGGLIWAVDYTESNTLLEKEVMENEDDIKSLRDAEHEEFESLFRAIE